MDRAEETTGPEDVGEQALMGGLDTAFSVCSSGAVSATTAHGGNEIDAAHGLHAVATSASHHSGTASRIACSRRSTRSLSWRITSSSSSSTMRCSQCSSFCAMSHSYEMAPTSSSLDKRALAAATTTRFVGACSGATSSPPGGRARDRAWPRAARREPRPRSVRQLAKAWPGCRRRAGWSSPVRQVSWG